MQRYNNFVTIVTKDSAFFARFPGKRSYMYMLL